MEEDSMQKEAEASEERHSAIFKLKRRHTLNLHVRTDSGDIHYCIFLVMCLRFILENRILHAKPDTCMKQGMWWNSPPLTGVRPVSKD